MAYSYEPKLPSSMNREQMALYKAIRENDPKSLPEKFLNEYEKMKSSMEV